MIWARTVFILVSSLFLFSCSAPTSNVKKALTEDDPDMIAAVAKAKETLPKFWMVHAAPESKDSDFALRVLVSEGSTTEALWIIKPVRKDGRIQGEVNNDPTRLQKTKIKDLIEVPETAITDWVFRRGDRYAGNYTARAHYKVMHPTDAASLQKTLIDL